MRLEFSSSDCTDLAYALRHEWLETNGLGGYASSTIIGYGTRKYHGLLVASLPPDGARFVLLSRVEDSASVGKQEFQLSSNKYPGVFHPRGYENIESFVMEDWPVTTFRLASARIERSVMMIRNENTVLIRYDLSKSGDKPVTLKIHPLIACRGFHDLTRENTALRVKTFSVNQDFKIEPYEGLPPLYFGSNTKLQFYPGPDWYRNVEYSEEQSRGYDFQEDLFCPGVFEKRLDPGEPLIFRVSIEPSSGDIHALWKGEIERRQEESAAFKGEDAVPQALKTSARHFLIKNHKGQDSVIAGYPWFGEWGRDSMISIPGLAFYCGHHDEGFEILKTFASYEKNGLLPNFLTGDEPAYNSIDSAFWFFWAAQEYLKQTGDKDAVVKHLFPAMQRIISAYLGRKVPNTELQSNGLLWAGNEGTQLTWMDATAWGRPVTPRHGLAIEINALWYNALGLMLQLVKETGSKIDRRIETVFKSCGEAMRGEFWNEKAAMLADVINEKGRDLSVRPNQIFAVSLPFSAFSKVQQERIIKVVDEELVTPYGLRTLSPKHPEYRSRYVGNQDIRDSAYHQGTVWPWLVGHFVEGFIRVSTDKVSAKRYLKKRFAALFNEHVKQAGLFGVSEIFDGDPPHFPNGCPNQAWSLAEVIRAIELLK